MDGTAAPAPAAAQPTSDPGAAGHVQAPDWVPADFKADFGSDGFAEKLARGYADKHAKLSTRLDDLRAQVKGEFEAERVSRRPKDAKDYAFSVEPGSDLAKAFDEHKVVFVDEMPEKPDPNVVYYRVNGEDSPTVQWWRQFCFDNALPPDVFSNGIAQIVLRDVRKDADDRAAEAQRIAEQDKAEMAKLGADGEKRREAARQAIVGHVQALLPGDDGKAAGEALALVCAFADGVKAVEAILKTSGGGLSPGGGGGAGASQDFAAMFPKTAAHYAAKRSA